MQEGERALSVPSSIAVLTSGGDAPGMNAALRAVVRRSVYEGIRIFGVYHGYNGLIRDEMIEMNVSSVSDILHRGGTILRTARSAEFMTSAGRDKALAALRGRGIEGLVVIGGDGSFRGALELMRLGFPVMGVPGTIDNDIEGTDYTIGFDTAVNTAVEAINKVRDTATSHERTFIVEVMGRDAGFIALAAGIAGGAEVILVPEEGRDLREICRRLTSGLRRGKLHLIVVVAEGAARAYDVAAGVTSEAGLETRVIVLGHLQRGGTPTAFDRILASRFGSAAVAALLEGRAGLMTGVRGDQLVFPELEACLAVRKRLDPELLKLAGILAI
ncbi:MAG: 6-phosphofructokinase [Firmicutes bacterium]|nr:6-phosphofructokinase [Bacillota bacterium]